MRQFCTDPPLFILFERQWEDQCATPSCLIQRWRAEESKAPKLSLAKHAKYARQTRGKSSNTKKICCKEYWDIRIETERLLGRFTALAPTIVFAVLPSASCTSVNAVNCVVRPGNHIQALPCVNLPLVVVLMLQLFDCSNSASKYGLRVAVILKRPASC